MKGVGLGRRKSRWFSILFRSPL
ncbi:unnamed protein product [Linum tenue]|uniref:Uncharacterized protein n=1 Tax=Linum tenue TaxID=586396 RepID=A0AAV0NUV0_9ROSI|nr:unnamed protein product [Linum tenue]